MPRKPQKIVADHDDGETFGNNASPQPMSAKNLTFAILAFVCGLVFFSDFKRISSLRLVMDDATPSIRREQLRPTKILNSEAPADSDQAKIAVKEGIGKKKQVPCQLLGIMDSTGIDFNSPDINVTEDASRFHASPLDSWTCHQEETDDYFLAFIEFQIQECPPSYSASAFQLQASTSRSRLMGHVGKRYRFRDECGFYNASVAIMDYDKNGTVMIELFWSTGVRQYSNHIKDIVDAHTIKQKTLPDDQIATMFTDERLAYLKRHLDRLPHFPAHLEVQVSRTAFSNNPLRLPDCGLVPLDDWNPAGVFDGPVNDSSPEDAKVPRWPFRSARCQFHARTLPQYNEMLAGLRIKYLGDSHMEMVNYEVKRVMCPKATDSAFFQHNYDCEFHNNTFIHAFRFFRMVFQQDFELDMDGVSRSFRIGSPKSCRQVLGLGLFNVTIIAVPHWIFVYETQEGLDNILISLQSLFENCMASHGDLMKNHTILLQSPSARDPVPENEDPARVWHSWRAIHNNRLEDFSYVMKDKLGKHVDGIIPFFEMCYARTVKQFTRDGIHLPQSSYRDMLHIQLTAVRSALKYSRGLELPLMNMDDPKVRWFAGLDQE